MNLYQIENKIEELRRLLNNSWSHHTSTKMVTLSQELDAYIAVYQKMYIQNTNGFNDDYHSK